MNQPSNETSEYDLARLAEFALERRREIGWTQEQVSNHSGLSLDRIQAVEAARGGRFRKSTLVKLDVGLCWESGSTEAVLGGGEAVAAEVPDEPGRANPMPQEAMPDQRVLVHLVTGATLEISGRQVHKDLGGGVARLTSLDDDGESGRWIVVQSSQWIAIERVQ